MIHNLDNNNYFKLARSWSDDYSIALELSRRRYQIAFLSMSGLVLLLIISLISLLPLQKIQLAIVHEGPSGETWVSTLDAGAKPSTTWGKEKSEIAHYVYLRESYDPMLYPYLSAQIRWFNDDLVQGEYLAAQSPNNHDSPSRLLSDKGFRTVKINSIVALDLESKNTDTERGHLNLAQVNYVITDHSFGFENLAESVGSDSPDSPNSSGESDNFSNASSRAYTALISWSYAGVPDQPEGLLQNWDGFVVSKYQTQRVNL